MSGRPRLRWSFLPALVIVLTALGLMPGIADRSAAASATGATVNIEIGDNFFAPVTSNITVGDTVVWTNKGKVPHDVTANGGAFASPRNLAPGATFSWTATAAGTFAYTCTLHARQDGTLVVVAAPAAPAAPVAAPRTGGGGMAVGPSWLQALLFIVLALSGFATLIVSDRLMPRSRDSR